LLRRVQHFDHAQLARRAELAQRLLAQLRGVFYTPGAEAPQHSHWAVPILSSDPAKLTAALQRQRFHATQARSLAAIAPPPDRHELTPRNSRRFIKEAVFLPIYSQMPERERDRLASLLLGLAALATLPSSGWQ
jgi:dTDP-4-amino-4,6-dideoxygalactose transaminase